MRIDSHQHYWCVDQFDYGWVEQGVPRLDGDYLPSELEPQLRRAKVDRSVVVQVLHTLAESEWLLTLAREHESVAGVVGWVDLTQDAAQIAADVNLLRSQGALVGIRHLVHEEPDEDWLVRTDVIRGLGALQELDMPFDLLLRPQHLKHVPTLSAALPELPMVIDHLAKPLIRDGLFARWLDDLRAAAANPRVYCKLSGLVTEADHDTWRIRDLTGYVDATIDTFSPDRVMFGSDWPVCTLAASYAEVVHALEEALTRVLGLEQSADRDRIFAGTAADFYELSHDAGKTVAS